MWGKPIGSLDVGGIVGSGLVANGLQRFDAAFKHWRHEGEAIVHDRTTRLIPSTDLWRNAGGHPAVPSSSRYGAPSGRGSAREGYTLIRSDVEDEDTKRTANKGLPGMPTHFPMMRQRTLQQLNTRGMSKKETDGGPFPWVQDDWFQWTSGCAIVTNAAVVGLETDIDSPLFFFFEQILLTFFCVELGLRIIHHRLNFFIHEEDMAWNMFDTSVVLVGIFDQWVVPVLQRFDLFPKEESNTTGNESMLLLVIIVLRYLRIIRLFRLVRIIRPLYHLSQGVLEALQGMFWVLVFVVMTLYSMAILCTRMIGHGDILSEEMLLAPEVQQIQSMFLSVPDSMFTLFGTISSWSLLKFVPLFEESPIFKPIFVLFYVYSAWALLAVMTGVVSENMMAIREQMVKEDEQREEMRKTMITNMLLEVFREADADLSGTVSRLEFEAMLRSPSITSKITKNTHLKVQDLQDLFDWLDHDGGGTITIDEFMAGFKWVNEPLRAKSLVKLQERLLSDLYTLEKETSKNVGERVSQVHKLVSAPLRKVHAITEQMQSLDVQFSRLRSTLEGQLSTTPTEKQIDGIEGKLLRKINLAIRQLEEMDPAKQSKQAAKKPR